MIPPLKRVCIQTWGMVYSTVRTGTIGILPVTIGASNQMEV